MGWGHTDAICIVVLLFRKNAFENLQTFKSHPLECPEAVQVLCRITVLGQQLEYVVAGNLLSRSPMTVILIKERQ